jgi:transposase
MLPLAPHATHQRDTLLALYPQLQRPIDDLNRQVEEQAQQRSQARRLMTHPGVGPVTALATEVFLGDPQRFVDGKAVASYIGMIPSEHSSGRRQRLGKLSKQGNSFLRFLWVEAAMHAVRRDPELLRFYRRKLVQKWMGIARVAAARKLGIRLWIMLRDAAAPSLRCLQALTKTALAPAAFLRHASYPWWRNHVDGGTWGT